MHGRRIAAISAVTIAVLAGVVAASPAAGITDLLARWSFNEGSGTTAADASGAGHTGTLSGNATCIEGKLGKALAFDGATGRVQVPASAALAPADGITVSAWVKSNGSPGPFRYIVSKGGNGCETGSYGIYTGRSEGIRFYVANGPTTYTLSSDGGTGVFDGQWHHVAGTYDGSAVHLYIDGVESGFPEPRTGPIQYPELSSADLFVGHYEGCSGLDFPGAVDDPRIYGRALSAGEIGSAMKFDFTGFFQPVDNRPKLNVAKAGSGIPVRFSLGGDEGLDIFEAGSPTSNKMACDSGASVDAIEETVTAGGSTLSYDPLTKQYTYVWKTDKLWAGTCRQLVVKFDDGTTQLADFQLTK